MTPSENTPIVTQPNLKAAFLIAAVVVVTVIVVMYWILQHEYEKESQLIHQQEVFEHQYALVNSIMADLASLIRDEADDVDYLTSRLLLQIQQLERGYEQVQAWPVSKAEASLSSLEQEVMKFVARLLPVVPVLAAEVVSNAQHQQILQNQYQSLLHGFALFKQKNRQLVNQIGQRTAQLARHFHQLLWWIAIGQIVTFLLIGWLFYRKVSGLVQVQMAALAEKQVLQQAMLDQRTEQEQRIKAIVDTTVEAIVTISEQGIIESFNKAAESMFGYVADQVIGQNVRILMPEPVASQHDYFLQRYRETGERKVIGMSVEVTAKRVDNTTFPVLLSISEVQLPDERIFTGVLRDLTQQKKEEAKLKQVTENLLEKQAILEQEEAIARHVFENITLNNNDILPEVAYWSVPLASFSGDLMLSATLPNGGIRIFLCDFTGHGLPAALGAVPVSSIFHAMSQKGLPLDMLMTELNRKLKSLLPTGIFCCISAIDMDAIRQHAHIWNAGLPDILLVSAEGVIKQRFASHHLPLGVMEYAPEELHCEDCYLEEGDIIYTYTDGLTETVNEAGDMLGQAGLEQILSVPTDQHGRLMLIQQQVIAFMGKAAASDDLSVIEICTQAKSDPVNNTKSN